jgi:hypothetical protein
MWVRVKVTSGADFKSFQLPRVPSNLSTINCVLVFGNENARDLSKPDRRRVGFHHTRIQCLVSSPSWVAKDRRKRTGRRCTKPRSSPTDEPKRARERSTSGETQSSLRTGESRSQSDVICILLSDSFDAIGTAISP